MQQAATTPTVRQRASLRRSCVLVKVLLRVSEDFEGDDVLPAAESSVVCLWHGFVEQVDPAYDFGCGWSLFESYEYDGSTFCDGVFGVRALPRG